MSKGASTAANHQKILLHLLNTIDENKYCCDCDAKGPRWASWNLGLFVCIRCSGIHRSLGVHISKVKSVNLDSWTAEQIESVLRMGNKKAREIYEAQLPPGHRRPQEDYALEQFIRNKYDKKMYADSQRLRETNFEKIDIEKYLARINGSRPKSATKGSGQIAAPPSNNKSVSSQEAAKAETKSGTYSTPSKPKQNVDELLNFGSSPPISGSQQASSSSQISQETVVKANSTQPQFPAAENKSEVASAGNPDLAGLIFESNPAPSEAGGISGAELFGGNGGDLFGNSSFGSSSSATEKSGGKKTTQDIMSLYGASNTASSFSPAPTSGAVNVNNQFAAPAYQWNQPINSQSMNAFNHSPLQQNQAQSVAANMSPFQLQSIHNPNGAAYSTQNTTASSGMYMQNSLNTQFGSLNFNSVPNMTTQTQHSSMVGMNNMSGNSFAPTSTANPFATSNPAQPNGSQQFSQINWAQPLTSNYSYNNSNTIGMGNTLHQSFSTPQFNSTASQLNMTPPQGSIPQLQQQNYQFANSAFASRGSQQQPNGWSGNNNDQSAPFAYNQTQNQQQSLWLK